MDIMYITMTLLVFALCFLVVQVFDFGGRVFKGLFHSLALFLIEYHIFAVVILWLDIFWVKYILFLMCFLNFILCIVFRKRLKEQIKKIQWKISKKEVCLIAFAMLLIPFIMIKSEDVRTSSDMGMYYEWVCKLNSNDASLEKELNEIGLISDSVDCGVLKIQEQLYGVNPIGGEYNDETLYEFHSLPTWTSFMALWGKLFGNYNATQVLSVYYLMSVFCCYYICEKIKKEASGVVHGVLLFALSPIIIYISKCTLTEISYVCFLFMGIYFLVQNKAKYKWLSSVCLGLLGFIHISNYIYIFAYFFVLLMLHIYTKNKIYGFINCIQLVAFIVSLIYVLNVSGTYSENQFSRLSFLGDNTCLIICNLILVIVACLLIQLDIILYKPERLFKLETICNKIFPVLLIMMEIAVLVGSIYYGYCLGFTEKYVSGGGTWHLRSAYANKEWYSLNHLNIVNIARATAYIYVPIIFVYNIVRKNKKDIVQNSVFFVFFYSILVYTYVQIDTPNNYYASRYFAMVIIPITALSVATIISAKRIYKFVVIWCLIYSLWFDIRMVDCAPFQGQYRIVQDVVQEIPYGNFVLVREEAVQINQTLVNILRETNGNYVFNYENYDEISAYYWDDIYIISHREVTGMHELVLYKEYDYLPNLGGGDGARYMTEVPQEQNMSIYIYILKK